jgi:hypothetical protein
VRFWMPKDFWLPTPPSLSSVLKLLKKGFQLRQTVPDVLNSKKAQSLARFLLETLLVEMVVAFETQRKAGLGWLTRENADFLGIRLAQQPRFMKNGCLLPKPSGSMLRELNRT